MQLLFQPFSQVDGGLGRRHDGTGLGLYLAQRLAKLLGGEITAESEFGRGSKFTLRLPLVNP
jgi:signal transduction histidine kinase